MKNIRFILKIVSYFPSIFFVLVTINACIGLLPPIQSYLLQLLIEVSSTDLPKMLAVLALYIFVWMIVAILPDINRYILAKFNSKLTEKFELEIIDTVKDVEMKYYENEGIHNIKHQLQRPGEQCTALLSCYLITLQQIVNVSGIIFLFARVSPIIVLAISLIFTFSIRYNIKEVENIKKLRVSQTPVSRMSDYISLLFTRIDAIKEMKAFHFTEYLIDKYNSVNKQMVEERTSVRRKSFWGGVFAFAIDIVFTLCSIWILAQAAVQGQISIAQVISLCTLLPSLCIMASWYIPSNFSNLRQYTLFWDAYEKLQNFEKEVWPIYSENALTAPLNIEFCNVWFRYPHQEQYVLKGLSVTFHFGKKTAIVGANGCGKSTIVKLMMGLYKPEKGDIFIGNVNINILSREQIQRIFSACLQNYCIYEGTIRQNLVLYNHKKVFSDDELKQIIAHMDLGESIWNLDFQIAFADNKTTNLSKGQNQKIALIRAMLSDANYVVLDEPTASLDPNMEEDFYRYIVNGAKIDQ